jgi:hypothetical protein
MSMRRSRAARSSASIALVGQPSVIGGENLGQPPRLAKESGVETLHQPAEDWARVDRKRKDKTLANAEWKSPADPDARIAKMTDGTTHLSS